MNTDYSGLKFGKLTVVGPTEPPERKKSGALKWLCRCECGGLSKPVISALKSGAIKSCGCLQREAASKNRKHGMGMDGKKRHKAYDSWAAMLARCKNPKHQSWKHYGGRGISVCKKWYRFDEFWSDMGSSWSAGLTIERNDVNGNYSKSNCRWATKREQLNNKRKSVKLGLLGSIKTITEWACELGVDTHAISRRKARGWSDEQALTTPFRHRARIVEQHN